MALTAFRLGELQRKMLEAAGRQDYETAIVLRDELKIARQVVQDAEPPPPPKVVDIITREEVKGGRQKKPKKVPVPEVYVDEDSLELLTSVFAEIKSGAGIGVCVVLGRPSQAGDLVDVECYISGRAMDSTPLFVGGAHTIAHDLLAIETDMMSEEFNEE